MGKRDLLILIRGSKTQSQVAKDLGISQKHLSAIELGNKNPSIKLIKQFEKYYKKSAIELFPEFFLNNNTTDSGKK